MRIKILFRLWNIFFEEGISLCKVSRGFLVFGRFEVGEDLLWVKWVGCRVWFITGWVG